MKKILGLTVAALLVMALVGGGTWAYFSDVETSTGNTFAAGTLDLKLTGGTQAIDSVTATWVTPADWKPGETISGTLTLDNVGTIDMTKVQLTVTTVDTGGANMAPYAFASSEPEYVAESGTYTAGVPNDDEVAINDISLEIDITVLTYNGVNLLVQTTPPTFDDVIIDAADNGGNNDGVLQLSELATMSNYDLIAAASLASLLGDGAAGTTHDLAVIFQFATGADNEYQGDLSTMTLSIAGMQQ